MKVLLAIDGSEGSEKAVGFLNNLIGGIKDMDITILHVVKPLDYRYVSVETGGPTWQKILDELEAGARQKARELLEETEGLFPKHIKTNVMVSVGDPATEIVNVAKEITADMIVMGSRGLGRIQGLLMGSVSNRVTNLAHCPVLVVR